MERPVRDEKDPRAIDEGSDTNDTIDWLLANVPNNNGRVGIRGTSYGGWLTQIALYHPHPAIKAASEQASWGDQFLHDDFHRNGAFRLAYGLEYTAMMESGKEDSQFPFDMYDTFEWFLRLGSPRKVDELYFHGKKPTWNHFVEHPNYDEFWKKRHVAQYVTNTVPNLHVSGWFDQEDPAGPFDLFEAAEKQPAPDNDRLVVGPWMHGGWTQGPGRHIKDIDFGSDTAQYYRTEIQEPWFNYWLKDKGQLKFAKVTAFQTGTNEWKSYEAWPPKTPMQSQPLYLRDASGLSFDPPKEAGSDASDSYISDPKHPIPYRVHPIPPTYMASSGWPTWLVDDQRTVDARPDMLNWQTAPLDDDVTVTGKIAADFFASTSGTDADWIVKLIDVYPDQYPANQKLGGYELMIASDVLRSRFHNHLDAPEPVKPGAVVEDHLDLRSHNHQFLKGHRIMVEIQSTWFPLIDRNPQRFVPNVLEAKESDYQSAKQVIYRSARYPSRILLPVPVQ
jgi:putative CocE/NonD family hydrolase